MRMLKRGLAALFLFLATSLFFTNGLMSHAGANDDSTWLNGRLYLNKVADVQPAAWPPTVFSAGNIDCASFIAGKCLIDTAYAAVAGSSLWQNGKWYPIADAGGSYARLMPIPGSDTAFTTSGASLGNYLYFNRGVGLIPKYKPIPGIYPIELRLDHFQVASPPQGPLQDNTATKIQVDTNSLAYSANSQWLMATGNNSATLRVNLASGQVLPFGKKFIYGYGANPMPKNAITSDGRYAAVGDARSATFTIYDLANCTVSQAPVTKPAVCPSRDLVSSGFMWQNIPGFSGIRYLRFWSDDVISFYASYDDGGHTKYAQYTLSTSPGPVNKLQYLALGDSYASGEGAYGYRAGTDTDTNHCHQSIYGYPDLLGYSLNYDSYRSVACSGAVTADITDTSIPDGNKRPQSQGKDASVYDDEIYQNYLPGYRAQINFVNQNQPRVITVMIGGNDIGFSGILIRCLEADTCYEWHEDRLELVKEIDNLLLPRLIDTYQKIKNQAAANTRIFAIGYPQIVKPDGDCGDNVRLNAKETEFSEGLIDYLDNVIEAAAKRVGINYLDAQGALDGFRLCEAPSGGPTGMNGITAGDDRPSWLSFIGAESYHPTRFGHQLIEQAIEPQLISDLKQAVPAPDPAAMPPAADSLDFLRVEAKHRPLNELNYNNDLSDNIIYRNGTWNVTVKGIKLYDYYLKHFTVFHFVLHSNEIDLGTATTDENGNLTAQIHIPADAPLGYHELHVLGEDVEGNPIDIYQIVYIADKLAAAQSEQNNSSSSSSTNDLATPVTNSNNAVELANIGAQTIGLADQADSRQVELVPGDQTQPKVLAQSTNRPAASPVGNNNRSYLPLVLIGLIVVAIGGLTALLKTRW